MGNKEFTYTGSAWVNTQVNKDIVLQKKNRLKGLALQEVVSRLIRKKYSAKPIDGSEDTINSIKESAKSAVDDLYHVKSTFMIIDNHGLNKKYYPQQSNHFDFENYLLDVSEFNFPVKLYHKSGSNNSSLGYKGCRSCYYCIPKKFCERCGGAVSEDRFKVLSKIKEKYDSYSASKIFNEKYPDEFHKPTNNKKLFLGNVKWIKEAAWNEGLISNGGSWGSQQWCTCSDSIVQTHSHSDYDKCPKCSNGRLKELRPGYSINEFEYVGKKLDKDQLKNKLADKELVTSSSIEGFGNSRLDDWLISDNGNNIFIIETKNYEETSISSKDLMQILKYIKGIRNSGTAKPSNADLIYNGNSSEIVEKHIEAFADKIDTELNLVNFKDFCTDIGIFPERIVISNDIDSYEKKLGEFKIDYSFSEEFVENPTLQIIIGDKKNG